MKPPGAASRRRLLIDSLTVVAAAAPEQEAWLAAYGVVADEIALDFDHAVRLADGLVADGALDPAVLPELRELDLLFASMSGEEQADRWTTDALAVDPGWNEARRLARRVLVAELGEWRRPLPEITVIR
ncbi:hypothetical protein [Streptomyces tritici]|uniref:hypothetical protein n=1 Tax=Streptomyces tritici TaxID=2054410 RepID=UPI003AF0BEA5